MFDKVAVTTITTQQVLRIFSELRTNVMRKKLETDIKRNTIKIAPSINKMYSPVPRLLVQTGHN